MMSQRDYFNNKVYRILREDFDCRMDSAVLQYIFSKGIDICVDITDEQIDEIEGNAFMTPAFCQALVKTARRIAKECDLFNDIFPYISYRYEVKGDDEYDDDLQ